MWRWVRTRPGCFTNKRSNAYSVADNLISRPARVTTCAVRSTATTLTRAQLGMIAEARQYLEHVRIGQPQLTLQWIREGVPYQTPETMERFLEGMRKAGVPAEMHIYQNGRHGLGMAKNQPGTNDWTDRCREWLDVRGLLKPATK